VPLDFLLAFLEAYSPASASCSLTTFDPQVLSRPEYRNLSFLLFLILPF
jgi:hypothetical protein